MPINLLCHEIYAVRDSLSDTAYGVTKCGRLGFCSPLCSEELLETLYISWNLFNSAPLDSPSLILRSQEVDKQWFFAYLSHIRITQVFFVHDVLAHISLGEISSLVQFLSALLRYLIEKEDLEIEDAATLSYLIFITWWNLGLAAPSQYVRLSQSLYDEFIRIMTSSGNNVVRLFMAISQFPEHANVLMTALLRLYVDAAESWKAKLEITAGIATESTQDPASRMLGVHPSVHFQHLHVVYQETSRLLNELTTTIPVSTNVMYTKSLYDSVVRILKQTVHCRSMVDSLHQRPDLPLSDCEINPEFVGRFSRIRDYILVRACRHLAMHSDSALFDDPFPSSFTCLIRAAAPKHLVSRLLSASASLPLATSSSSYWDTATCGTDMSFAPHLELICRALDRGTNILGLAIWFVQYSDAKDVLLANSIISRLLRFAPLLSVDSQFAFLLIARVDYVRQLALPEQNYLKLLRTILSNMTVEAKVQLLSFVHSDKNRARASPLSRNPNQLESRMRLLFNRIVVTDVGVDSGMDNTQNALRLPNLKGSAVICDPDVLLDCELLLLTCPLFFLTELIRLPVTRRCPAARLAVHQILNNLSYALGICVPDSTGSGSRKRPGRTILQSLLLSGLFSPHNSSCTVSSSSTELIISDVDWDVVDDTLWHYEDVLVDLGKCIVPSREPIVLGGDEESTSGILSFTALADPVVSTVVHLFEIAPNEVCPLLRTLQLRLAESEFTEYQWNIHTARVVHILLLAVASWSAHASIQDCCDVLDQVICLFVHFHSSDTLQNPFSESLDTAGLLGYVTHMLVKLSGASVSPNSVKHIDNTLSSKAGTGFCRLSYWILWSQSRQLLDDRVPPVQKFEWHCEPIVMQDLSRLLDWSHICHSFHLSDCSDKTATIDNGEFSRAISPRAFCALLQLSSISDYSLDAVLRAAEKMFQRDSTSWSVECLPAQNILLSVCMFLRTVSLTKRPVAWWRGFRLLNLLVKAGILWIPYRIGGEKLRGMSTIYLIDWTRFRGCLDFLSLFADLIQVQTLLDDEVTYEVAMRLLCITLLAILRSVLDRIKSTDDDRLLPFVRMHVRQTLINVESYLESAKKLSESRSIISASYRADFERLCTCLSTSITNLDKAS